jgi:predicted PurR-regulated permease PerM
MVKLAGLKLSQKKISVQVLDEITTQIQRYLLVQLLVSVIVGVLTGFAFYAIGLEQAAVWGVVAGATNLVPYVGAIATRLGVAVVATTQSALWTWMIAGASSFAIHAVVGNILTPWWMGRTSRISPIAVFLSLLVLGWM